MVRSYSKVIKFRDIHSIILKFKPTRTEIPSKKNLRELKDNWIEKIASVKLYATKIAGGNFSQMLYYLGGSLSWNALSKRVSELPVSKKKSTEQSVTKPQDKHRLRKNVINKLIELASGGEHVHFVQNYMYI